ncbi:hypothetical protein GYMLUDRAFT_65467 [Collybiopsis luxurians FD-317 M1]|uniref:Unplaced genomic scaffold GYMLUscaffold_199, whole genome shotgun sequence n=1 Tax=Collybiopsis luxurians FD-317 M1 TaxID=944289 RepID=A0A0D0AIM9_9AGAR|nr:hypothetical protein GYMLUDRAFT_65467 [Collybiopsis luxurians FD-317 M1]
MDHITPENDVTVKSQLDQENSGNAWHSLKDLTPSKLCCIIYPRPATEWLVKHRNWVAEAEKQNIHIYSDVWITEEGILEPIVKLEGPRNPDVIDFADNLVKVCGFKVLLQFQDSQKDKEVGEDSNSSSNEPNGGNGKKATSDPAGALDDNDNVAQDQGGDRNKNQEEGKDEGSHRDEHENSGRVEEGNRDWNENRSSSGTGDGTQGGGGGGGRGRSGGGGGGGGGGGDKKDRGESGNRNGTGGGDGGGDGSGGEGNGSSDVPYVQTGITWHFRLPSPNPKTMLVFFTRIHFRFPVKATEAKSAPYPHDHLGTCTIQLEESGSGWQLQKGWVHAWVNENAKSLTVESEYAHIKAPRHYQKLWNIGATVTGAHVPSGSITGGIGRNTNTHMFRPFYTTPAAARLQHGIRGKALQIHRAKTSGMLTGKPELPIEMTVESAMDQAQMNIETYWTLAPGKRESNYEHEDPFKSLEALFICHNLTIPNIFNFSSHNFEDTEF